MDVGEEVMLHLGRNEPMHTSQCKTPHVLVIDLLGDWLESIIKFLTYDGWWMQGIERP